MDSVPHALRGAAWAPSSSFLRLQNVLVVGGGGVLGSALLGEALVAGRFQRVGAVISAAIASGVRAFDTVTAHRLRSGKPLDVDLAFIVFERARHSNGRDAVFFQPSPSDLVALARQLHAAGARRLVVVVPHAPALLPQALQQGFASRDEAAVAALGFEQVVFMRTAQVEGSRPVGSLLRRFAAWWLSQLRWMVPTHQQPVRAVAVAQFAIAIGRALPAHAGGTRVVPDEVLWRAAKSGQPDAAAQAWLAGQPLTQPGRLT